MIFRCVNRGTNSVNYPTLKDVRLLFQDYWNRSEYVGRGEYFGTVEIVFKTEEAAVKVAKKTMENIEWLLFPSYMGKVVKNIKVGVILPKIEPARIVAVVLKNIQSYTILSISQRETLFFWGYGVEIAGRE